MSATSDASRPAPRRVPMRIVASELLNARVVAPGIFGAVATAILALGMVLLAHRGIRPTTITSFFCGGVLAFIAVKGGAEAISTGIKHLFAYRYGVETFAHVEASQPDPRIEVNGSRPQLIGYTVAVDSWTYPGELSTWDEQAKKIQPGEVIRVLYVPGRPSWNVAI